MFILLARWSCSRLVCLYWSVCYPSLRFLPALLMVWLCLVLQPHKFLMVASAPPAFLPHIMLGGCCLLLVLHALCQFAIHALPCLVHPAAYTAGFCLQFSLRSSFPQVANLLHSPAFTAAFGTSWATPLAVSRSLDSRYRTLLAHNAPLWSCMLPACVALDILFSLLSLLLSRVQFSG